MNYHAADHTLIICSHLHFASSSGWTTWMDAIVSSIRITHNNGMDPTLFLLTKIYVRRSTSRTRSNADFHVENLDDEKWLALCTQLSLLWHDFSSTEIHVHHYYVSLSPSLCGGNDTAISISTLNSLPIELNEWVRIQDGSGSTLEIIKSSRPVRCDTNEIKLPQHQEMWQKTVIRRANAVIIRRDKRNMTFIDGCWLNSGTAIVYNEHIRITFCMDSCREYLLVSVDA